MTDPAPRAEPVGFGVIGGRSMVATRAVMPALDASAHGRLAAVASRSGEVPEPWTHLGVGDYDDVLLHPDVDVVYLALPNGMHREWTERTVAAGKHVLCEKPIAATTAEAIAMFDAADHAGVLLAEAWMTPFDARWRTALHMASDGTLGDVVDIDASFTFTIDDADNYRWSTDQGGGALLDVGIYCLGPIVELWGTEPDLIDATALWHTSGVDARTEATLEWVDGRQARIRCSFVDAEEQRLEMVGTEASLVLVADAHTGGERATTITVVGAATGQRAGVSPRTVTATDPYLGMVDAFALAVLGEAPWPRPMSATIDLLTLIERIGHASP
jgi:D-xylose 1-dehydrogenase (NADP+, D-xylono-1,5-lactone-forming)